MANERAKKRQRIGEYLDLEAGVDHGNESEESSGAEDDRLFLEDDDPEDDQPGVYTHASLQSEYNRVALDEQFEQFWQGIINRARSRSHISDEEDGEQWRGPRPEDKLWEIGCQIGKEEVAVFHLMQKALPHNNSFSCSSAFARHTVPGRIFVEAYTYQQVIAATSGIPELIPAKMRLVPDEKMTEVLSMAPSPRPKDQGWVRLSGNTKKLRRYKGDLALVVDVSGTSLLQLWLIPRIQYNNDAADSRPSPQLFNAEAARLSFGDQCVREKTGYISIFQKNEFTTQGYLVLSEQELLICEELEALPTPQELAGFLECEALLPSTVVETRRRIESTKVELNNRVKVLRGPFRGLLGRVIDIAGDEVEIHLPSQDLIERVMVWDLAREFRVGDRVRARMENEEILGWITMVSDSQLSVFNKAKWSEITVSALQLEFYEDEKVIPLRCTAPISDIERKAMKENPYKRLIGKQVKVVRRNDYKGTTGIIKDITPTGEASVFLDIFNERAARQFKLKNLCLVRQDTLVMIESGEVRQPPKLVAPSVPVPSASTPMPTEAEVSHNADAWDACAPDPDLSPDGPIWLTDPVFGRTRIKLRYRVNSLPAYLEFLGMENGLAKVRDGMQQKLVPLSSLRAIPPSWKDDIVTSFSLGETHGKLYKIREFDTDFCVLRAYGERPGRSEKNVRVLTRELAQAFPPAK